MAINAFRSNNCFVACEELTGTDAFYTGLMTGSIMSAIQSSSFEVSLKHDFSKQLGSRYYSIDSLNRQPDVGLTLSYIPSYPYFNEGFVNLADLSEAPVTSDATVSMAALSGFESASRNFYIFTRPEEGYDALSGFATNDDLNFSGYQCASVGNCYLTDYSLSYTVGSLPLVEAQFIGSNMQYEQVTGTKVGSPAINLASGNANQVGELTLSGLRQFAQNPVIMNPGDTGSLITLENLQVGGQALAGRHLLQSVEFNLGIPRNAAYGLGSDYVYGRKMLLPAVGSLSVSSLVSGWEAGVISGILGSESDYSLDLTLAANGRSLTYKIQDAKLGSYTYGMGVNGLMAFDASFEFEVSPNPGGLQISGSRQESLGEHATEQIRSRIDASMSVGTNGSMLTDYTAPDGVLEGGGYGAARSSDFWAADIDFTAVSVWNSKGYNFGAGTDYRCRVGTAITPRHIIMAKHFQIYSNTVWFAEPDGTWISRTIEESREASSADLAVGLLDSDLPSTITPAKTLPSDFPDYFNYGGTAASIGAISSDFQFYVVGFDFEKKALVQKCTKLGYWSLAQGNPTVAPFSSLAESLTNGDSGNPCFMIVNGEAVLLATWLSTVSGPSIPYWHTDFTDEGESINALIALCDSDAGISTGYTVQVIDLGFGSFVKYPD